MNLLDLNIHLICDPSQPPDLPGDRGLMANSQCKSTRQNQQSTKMSQANFNLISNLKDEITILLYKILDIYFKESEYYKNLDIFIYESELNYRDAIESKGVMGFYRDGTNEGADAPHIELFVIPGREAWLKARSVHELGHFIRNSIPYGQSGDLPYIYAVFNEGLSECLVEEILGKEYLLHNLDLSKNDLKILRERLKNSQKDIKNGQNHLKVDILGYRLGYHIISSLLLKGRSLKSLFRLPADQTTKIILDGCNDLIQRL